MEKLSHMLTEQMKKQDIITSDKASFISYGIRYLFFYIICILTAILIGWLTSNVLTVIIFLLAFTPLRSYAGGFHLNGRVSCFVSSNLLILAIALLSPLLAQADIRLQLVLLVLAGGVIYAVAPLGCRNRELDAAETNAYRRIARVLMAIQLVLVPVLWLTPFRLYAAALLFSLLSEAILLCIEWMRRKANGLL